jgi:hypothetical protein
MGPFWRPGEIVKGASKLMEGNLDLFEFSFLFFSVKAPAQKEKEL